MKTKRIHLLLAVLGVAVLAIPFREQVSRPVVGLIHMVKGKRSVDDRVAQFGEAVQARLAPDFERLAIEYPPKRVTLVGLKAQRLLEVWVADQQDQWKHLRSYPILGMSGLLGPKTKEGDMQVPEGIYEIESLNPNSLYHLSLRVNYPNDQDKARAASEGRSQLGSDIMIHGKTCSVGCLAMGDTAAEDLFVLAAKTGPDNVAVILSPVDFRVRDLPVDMPAVPKWTSELYDSIRKALAALRGQQHAAVYAFPRHVCCGGVIENHTRTSESNRSSPRAS